VQGELGLIPETAAKAIHRATMELQVDPGALAAETGRNAVPVPALVAAFRAEMKAPEHAQFVHWGATSQDIMDTGLVLRLRKVLEIAEARIGAALNGLAALAEAHADTPMAARTYGQAATPTSFGAVAAGWGAPLLQLTEELAHAPPPPPRREPWRRGGNAVGHGRARGRRSARGWPRGWASAIPAAAGTPTATGWRRWRRG
jgi:3-carboxy-cis,cis-muconate cycloisomerase